MKQNLKNSSQLADTCRGSFPQPIHFLRDQLISDASRDADADNSIDEESDVLGCRWLYMATKGLTIAPRWSSCLSVVACCYWSRCNQTWIYMNKYSWTWIISYRLARFSRTLVPTRIVLNKVLSEISLLWLWRFVASMPANRWRAHKNGGIEFSEPMRHGAVFRVFHRIFGSVNNGNSWKGISLRDCGEVWSWQYLSIPHIHHSR